MKQLPYDMCRCSATQFCPDKERCARFTSQHNPDGFQCVLDASVLRSPEKCGMFEDNEEVPNV